MNKHVDETNLILILKADTHHFNLAGLSKLAPHLQKECAETSTLQVLQTTRTHGTQRCCFIKKPVFQTWTAEFNAGGLTNYGDSGSKTVAQTADSPKSTSSTLKLRYWE